MAKFYNVTDWIEENKQFFLPPVCNKMMHSEGQMKLFFVGGPNQRKDYHIDVGEELFYQIKGDMVLKVVEKGQHRDVVIKEGEMFLLPGRIEHSPQRVENTVGLVIERERADTEFDGLRYFIEEDGKPTTESLYEEWFHCEDLGPQLAAIIKRYFTTEQFKTGKPIEGTIPKEKPVKLDTEMSLQEPFSFKVMLYGPGNYNLSAPKNAEYWIWQFEGTSNLTLDAKQDCELKAFDSVLLPEHSRFNLTIGENSLCLTYTQVPNSPYYSE